MEVGVPKKLGRDLISPMSRMEKKEKAKNLAEEARRGKKSRTGDFLRCGGTGKEKKTELTFSSHISTRNFNAPRN